MTAAVLVGTYCLVRALSGDRRRWWWGYAASIVVAATLHEFAVLAVVAHGVMVLLSRPAWRVWRWWLVSALACAALVAPLAVASLKQSDQLSYMTAPTRSTFEDLGEKFFGTSPWLPVLLVGLVVLGTVPEVRRWRRQEGGELAVVGLSLLLVPVVVLLAVSVVQPLFGVRYVLFCVAGLPLLAARGVEQLAALATRRTSRTGAGWAVAALLVAGVSLAQLPDLRYERTLDSRHEDFAGAAGVVREQAQPGDAVIFIPMSCRLAEMSYPDAFSQVDDVALKRSAAQADNLRGTPRTPRATRTAMLAHDRIWLVGTRHLVVKGNDKVGIAEMAVLREHFAPERSFLVHGVQIVLYVRTDA